MEDRLVLRAFGDPEERLDFAQLPDLQLAVVVLGSGELVRSLLDRRLVDELILLIHPILLGAGRRLFADGAARSDLTLAGTRTTGTGVVVATHRAYS